MRQNSYMAARKLTPVGQIAKWIVLPAALAAAGYFLLGPRVGTVLPGTTARKTQAPLPSPEVEVEQQRTIDPPEVSVDSAPISQVQSSERRSRRKKRRNAVTTTSAPSQTNR